MIGSFFTLEHHPLDFYSQGPFRVAVQYDNSTDLVKLIPKVTNYIKEITKDNAEVNELVWYSIPIPQERLYLLSVAFEAKPLWKMKR